MMIFIRYFIFLFVFLITQGCCTQKSLFVLLPDPDGKVGQIIVSNPKGTQVLTKAGQATRVVSAQDPPEKTYQLDEKEITKVFGSALAAQPEPPLHYILYFEQDSTQLTESSRNLLPMIVDSIAARKSVDTSLVGHCDTVGSKEYNYELSQRRARAVGNLLVSTGVDPDILEITSHGEENPLIETGENVPEPRNRRVEVTVR